MNIKHLLLTAFGSFFLLTSCGTQKVQTKTITKVVRDTIFINPKTEKPEIARFAKLDDFKVNTNYFPATGQDERVRHLVLHYTSMDQEPSLRVLSTREVSAHYVIGDSYDDDIYAIVDETKRAWHAGASKWKTLDNINFSSIGIEIVNKSNDNKYGGIDFLPYPEHQFKKVAALTKDIVDRYKIEPTNVIGHSDIAPGRKHDPGPTFPWKRLYTEYGVGAWYENYDKDYYLTLYPYDTNSYTFISQFQKDLNKYGYNITATGTWDDQTKKVIQAFQYHFRPENYSGLIDAETWAILQALNKKYSK